MCRFSFVSKRTACHIVRFGADISFHVHISAFPIKPTQTAEGILWNSSLALKAIHKVTGEQYQLTAW
jgi:hypothetical protein